MAIRGLSLLALTGLLLTGVPATAHATSTTRQPTVTLLASGLQASTGSGTTLGPDGALYVTEGKIGRISRVDLRTGKVSTFAEGLPRPVIPVGGVMDVAFIGRTAYAIVTNVGPDLGGKNVVGLYRIDGRHRWTVVADIGTWSIKNPSKSEVSIRSGVLYTMQRHHGGFLVTDGHHNRVLHAGLDGRVRAVLTLGNVVPTGLDLRGERIYTALAGAVPHRPEDGQVITYTAHRPQPRTVASGAPLLVDVEVGHGRTLFGLAQGRFTPGQPPGAPAQANTGLLMHADEHGSFVPVVTGLDRPTSFEIVGDTAYVATLDGKVWKVGRLSAGCRGH
jgi:hypothetical protein